MSRVNLGKKTPIEHRKLHRETVYALCKEMGFLPADVMSIRIEPTHAFVTVRELSRKNGQPWAMDNEVAYNEYNLPIVEDVDPQAPHP